LAESGRLYPGLDVTWPAGSVATGLDEDPIAGQVLAATDDHHPVAVEDAAGGLRVFFSTTTDRDHAADALRQAFPQCGATPVDVPDDHWAERSQASLKAITVGSLTIAPPWDLTANRQGLIIIQPSMGFGTGHHASTRLCLRLLQETRVAGARVLDVGTGSGVLAIAAWKLSAASVVAIDYDADAITSARECAELNDISDLIDIRQVDLDREPTVDGAPFSLVLANLTGGMLVRLAARLCALLTPGGTLIVSGITREEEDAVTLAFAAEGATITARAIEEEWVGLRLTTTSGASPGCRAS
jgi:ribosomal protein L11 methyltransferase